MSGPDDLPPAGVPPQEAIDFFRSKGFRIGFNWQDVFKAEHVRWFTVAKAMTRDILEDIRAAVDSAIADGTTLSDFKKTLRPTLEAKGWWGKKHMLDPATGQHELVQLGSPRRLKTIFDTNVRTAYQAGKWERIQRTKAAFPFLEYSCVMDGRERPQHHDWDGVILPVDDSWWDTHYGPCDWNCRCSAIARSQRMLDRMGRTVDAKPPPANDLYEWTNSRTGETGTLEKGIGKGWDYNVGKEYLRGLAPSPLPDDFDGPEEIGAAAQLTGTQTALIDRFLAAFDIAPKEDGPGEAIWMDRDGWPLSIGRGWWIAQGGAVRLPKGAAGVAIDRIAAAIVQADTIRWIWVRSLDGRALLFRRYARTANGITTLVDVGREGWRWVSGGAKAIAAAYDPHQPRDKNGKWARSGSSALPLDRAPPLPLSSMRIVANTEEAAGQAATFAGKTLRNGDMEATVSKATIGKMKSSKAVRKSTSPEDHALAMANVDKLFPRATLVESGPDARGERTITAFHRYHAHMETPRGVVDVKISVKETSSPKNPNPLYTVETIAIK